MERRNTLLSTRLLRTMSMNLRKRGVRERGVRGVKEREGGVKR